MKHKEEHDRCSCCIVCATERPCTSYQIGANCEEFCDCESQPVVDPTMSRTPSEDCEAVLAECLTNASIAIKAHLWGDASIELGRARMFADMRQGMAGR